MGSLEYAKYVLMNLLPAMARTQEGRSATNNNVTPSAIAAAAGHGVDKAAIHAAELAAAASGQPTRFFSATSASSSPTNPLASNQHYFPFHFSFNRHTQSLHQRREESLVDTLARKLKSSRVAAVAGITGERSGSGGGGATAPNDNGEGEDSAGGGEDGASAVIWGMNDQHTTITASYQRPLQSSSQTSSSSSFGSSSCSSKFSVAPLEKERLQLMHRLRVDAHTIMKSLVSELSIAKSIEAAPTASINQGEACGVEYTSEHDLEHAFRTQILDAPNIVLLSNVHKNDEDEVEKLIWPPLAPSSVATGNGTGNGTVSPSHPWHTNQSIFIVHSRHPLKELVAKCCRMGLGMAQGLLPLDDTAALDLFFKLAERRNGLRRRVHDSVRMEWERKKATAIPRAMRLPPSLLSPTVLSSTVTSFPLSILLILSPGDSLRLASISCGSPLVVNMIVRTLEHLVATAMSRGGRFDPHPNKLKHAADTGVKGEQMMIAINTSATTDASTLANATRAASNWLCNTLESCASTSSSSRSSFSSSNSASLPFSLAAHSFVVRHFFPGSLQRSGIGPVVGCCFLLLSEGARTLFVSICSTLAGCATFEYRTVKEVLNGYGRDEEEDDNRSDHQDQASNDEALSPLDRDLHELAVRGFLQQISEFGIEGGLNLSGAVSMGPKDVANDESGRDGAIREESEDDDGDDDDDVEDEDGAQQRLTGDTDDDASPRSGPASSSTPSPFSSYSAPPPLRRSRFRVCELLKDFGVSLAYANSTPKHRSRGMAVVSYADGSKTGSSATATAAAASRVGAASRIPLRELRKYLGSHFCAALYGQSNSNSTHADKKSKKSGDLKGVGGERIRRTLQLNMINHFSRKLERWQRMLDAVWKDEELYDDDEEDDDEDNCSEQVQDASNPSSYSNHSFLSPSSSSLSLARTRSPSLASLCLPPDQRAELLSRRAELRRKLMSEMAEAEEEEEEAERKQREENRRMSRVGSRVSLGGRRGGMDGENGQGSSDGLPSSSSFSSLRSPRRTTLLLDARSRKDSSALPKASLHALPPLPPTELVVKTMKMGTLMEDSDEEEEGTEGTRQVDIDGDKNAAMGRSHSAEADATASEDATKPDEEDSSDDDEEEEEEEIEEDGDEAEDDDDDEVMEHAAIPLATEDDPEPEDAIATMSGHRSAALSTTLPPSSSASKLADASAQLQQLEEEEEAERMELRALRMEARHASRMHSRRPSIGATTVTPTQPIDQTTSTDIPQRPARSVTFALPNNETGDDMDGSDDEASGMIGVDDNTDSGMFIEDDGEEWDSSDDEYSEVGVPRSASASVSWLTSGRHPGATDASNSSSSSEVTALLLDLHAKDMEARKMEQERQRKEAEWTAWVEKQDHEDFIDHGMEQKVNLCKELEKQAKKADQMDVTKQQRQNKNTQMTLSELATAVMHVVTPASSAVAFFTSSSFSSLSDYRRRASTRARARSRSLAASSSWMSLTSSSPFPWSAMSSVASPSSSASSSSMRQLRFRSLMAQVDKDLCGVLACIQSSFRASSTSSAHRRSLASNTTRMSILNPRSLYTLRFGTSSIMKPLAFRFLELLTPRYGVEWMAGLDSLARCYASLGLWHKARDCFEEMRLVAERQGSASVGFFVRAHMGVAMVHEKQFETYCDITGRTPKFGMVSHEISDTDAETDDGRVRAHSDATTAANGHVYMHGDDMDGSSGGDQSFIGTSAAYPQGVTPLSVMVDDSLASSMVSSDSTLSLGSVATHAALHQSSKRPYARHHNMNTTHRPMFQFHSSSRTATLDATIACLQCTLECLEESSMTILTQGASAAHGQQSQSSSSATRRTTRLTLNAPGHHSHSSLAKAPSFVSQPSSSSSSFNITLRLLNRCFMFLHLRLGTFHLAKGAFDSALNSIQRSLDMAFADISGQKEARKHRRTLNNAAAGMVQGQLHNLSRAASTIIPFTVPSLTRLVGQALFCMGMVHFRQLSSSSSPTMLDGMSVDEAAVVDESGIRMASSSTSTSTPAHGRCLAILAALLDFERSRRVWSRVIERRYWNEKIQRKQRTQLQHSSMMMMMMEGMTSATLRTSVSFNLSTHPVHTNAPPVSGQHSSSSSLTSSLSASHSDLSERCWLSSSSFLCSIATPAAMDDLLAYIRCLYMTAACYDELSAALSNHGTKTSSSTSSSDPSATCTPSSSFLNGLTPSFCAMQAAQLRARIERIWHQVTQGNRIVPQHESLWRIPSGLSSCDIDAITSL